MNASRTNPNDLGVPIETATGATFEELVRSDDGPIVVEFMSYGCSHCRALEPVITQVAASLASRVRVVRVNVAVDAELTANYAVRVTPTLVMFLHGTEIARIEGPSPIFARLLDAMTRSFGIDIPAQ